MPGFSLKRLRDPQTLKTFTRVFAARTSSDRGTEAERLALVPLVFGLLPVSALTRRRPDERIKPLIRQHLKDLGLPTEEPLVDALKDVADQYFDAALRPSGERKRKLGIESVRALRGDTYAELRARQAGRCAVCGARLGADTVETLDHIIPWLLVGDPFDGSNWQLLCADCNSGKREWLSALQSPQANNWHYGAGDTLPFAEPTLEARYVALAVAGHCQFSECSVRPNSGQLRVRRQVASGLAVVDNLAVLCEDHLADPRISASEPVLPLTVERLPQEVSASTVQHAVSPAPSPVQHFDGYLLERRLSAGMAEAYLAVDEETGEEVFLKRAWDDSEQGPALQRESAIYQKLVQRYAEHVPRVLAAGRAEGYFYLVTERAEFDLETFVFNAETISTPAVREIACEIIEGLRELHSMNIVHRDLKPSNVLRVGGRWLLADFGISKDHGGALARETFKFRGTTGYAAPEQILTGVEAEPAADIFALGKIIVFLLTRSTDIDRVLFRSWRDLARRCVAEVPSERPTLDAIVDELDRIRE